MKISRRKLALATASASLGAVSTKALAVTTQDKVKWTETVDVLVLGAGLAGMCAAIEAKEAGAKRVLILEKGSFVGGHALLSGGGYVACGTRQQKAAGIDDSPDIDFADAVARGIAGNGFLKYDTDVVRQVYDRQAEGLEWLEKHGVKFVEKPSYGYGNRNRIHYFAPGARVGNAPAIQAVQQALEKSGAELRLETKLVELVTKDSAVRSPVVGAVVEAAGGKKLYIKAKNVVLATGGFGVSQDLVGRYQPYLKGIPSFSSPLNTGDGIKAALDIGAYVIPCHHDFGGNISNAPLKDKSQRINSFTPGNMPLIVVTDKAERFIDESRGGRHLSAQELVLGLRKTTWIFDEQSAPEAKENWFKPLFARNVVNQYQTIEELAKGEGLDPAALKKTIDTYNKDAAAGKDSVFGRTKLLRAIDKAPFYAITGSPAYLYTYSGIAIDTEGRVTHANGGAIPNLYAAGDTAGRLDSLVGLGTGGVSGLSVATVTGRIAGRNAATK